jgi:hypothetical protein
MSFGLIWLFAAIGTSTYYWLSRGRNEEFLIGRFKTTFVFFFWPVYIAYLIVVRVRAESRQVNTERAKKRILD